MSAHSSDCLLILSPLTQVNTPYPSTAYLSNYLRRQGWEISQADLGIEIFVEIFQAKTLRQLFAHSSLPIDFPLTTHLSCLDACIEFLQGKKEELSKKILSRQFFPESPRFAHCQGEEWKTAFANNYDCARHLASLYLEDMGTLVQEHISPQFSFTRYAESLAISASHFDKIADYLEAPRDPIEKKLLALFEKKIKRHQPKSIAFSIPFPGNLIGALICAKFAKEHYPEIPIIMGGGYVNTELRQMTDTGIFQYIDYLSFDDGENSLDNLLTQLIKEGNFQPKQAIRIKYLENDEVKDSQGKNVQINHDEIGWPDYDGLDLSLYLSILDTPNPMMRIWSDGRWNKMTLAHGCYWARCSFCDVTLDYIARYDEAPASVLCDRIESIIEKTGERGFHFVDEAAPPALILEFCLEVLKRGLDIKWWANIRFERAFSPGLAQLMAASGCIAVSGGLEVASERLLKLIRKGTGLKQVVESTQAFSQAGILVHAYLMYGFPTETEQETIDSLEVVRQLFAHELIDSGFWHRFALTIHSPIYREAEKFKIEITSPTQPFANNEVSFRELENKCEHGRFTEGLNKALFNYMHHNCLDWPVPSWFEYDAGLAKMKTSHHQDTISTLIERAESLNKKTNDSDLVLWLGPEVLIKDDEFSAIIIGEEEISLDPALNEWLFQLFAALQDNLIEGEKTSFSEVREFFLQYFKEDLWQDFISSSVFAQARSLGLCFIPKIHKHFKSS